VKSSLFDDVPESFDEELFVTLAEGAGARVERIVSPPGHSTEPGFWYDQDRPEWVMVVRGGAAIEIAGEPQLVKLGPGDHLVLPARMRHRVAWTSAEEPTVWLAVHYV
jgi:cupin 2 domain-containing protein